MKHQRMILVVVLAFCAVVVGTAVAQSNKPNVPDAAVSTAFTYQGQIKRNGALFTGTCDMQFKLWDAVTAGIQQGLTLNVNAVPVNNGVFAVELNFGNQFKGDARWLETAAKCADDAGFTALPRVALNPAPYAIGLMPGAQTQGSLAGSAGIFRAVNTGPGAALVGLATSSTGATYGVLGNAFSPNGYAVTGYADGGATGVQGWSDSSGAGVWGHSATGSGVYGESPSLHGVSGHSDTGSGVYGYSNSYIGVEGYAYSGTGVRGDSTSGWGVHGESISSRGVIGRSSSDVGVFGQSTSGVGVYGESTSYEGVRGVAHDINHGAVVGIHDGGGFGVYGNSSTGAGVVGSSTTWVGVYGESNNQTGVWGKSLAGFAMRADGPASQSLESGGWVKAMIYLDPARPAGQQIVRCFNSQATGSAVSIPPCGFTATSSTSGDWDINFGFNVTQRFAVATTTWVGVGAAIGYGTLGINAIGVSTYYTSNGNPINVPFTLIVY